MRFIPIATLHQQKSPRRVVYKPREEPVAHYSKGED